MIGHLCHVTPPPQKSRGLANGHVRVAVSDVHGLVQRTLAFVLFLSILTVVQ